MQLLRSVNVSQNTISNSTKLPTLEGVITIMRIKFPQILPLALALAATSSAGFAKELDLWFTPMSSEGPMKLPLTQWLKEKLPTDLPGVTVNNNFGPPVYQDGQQKFVVQGPQR